MTSDRTTSNLFRADGPLMLGLDQTDRDRRPSAGSGGDTRRRSTVEERDLGRATTRGLMVRDPYASQLLIGEKTWEIRGRTTQIRGPIVIIKSGTGQAFGTVELVSVLGPLAIGDLVSAEQLPADERREFQRHGLPYKKTFAYVVRNPKWFSEPVAYKHPYGAVTWVNLPAIDLSRADYASSSRQHAQLQLV